MHIRGAMWSFLAEFFRRTDRPVTVLVMDDEFREHPRQYQVDSKRLLAWIGGGTVLLALLLLFLVVFTPLREFIPGYGTSELRSDARLAAVRLAALQDSLDAQQQYMVHLQQMLTGQFDSSGVGGQEIREMRETVSGELAEVAAEPNSKDWADHEQPALPVSALPVVEASGAATASVGTRYLSSLQLPALAPVSGYLTRGFDARAGHYAVDLAVDEGTMVRSIGDGYVVFADWTHEGGYAVAVQHAGGYVSIYKHNKRLLKRVGDRVRAREAVAVSGNSGEFTSGPHLHFELWLNGLAQDPRNYLVGL